MAVGFITGRFGADRTDKILELCFEEAKREDKKPIYILVPEKFTYEMEKRLSEKLEDEKNIDPNFRIRVVSFWTLSKIVFTNVGGLKERRLTTSARSLLTFKAMDLVSKELVTFKSDDFKMGFVNNIMDMIIEFKQNDFSVSDVFSLKENVKNESLKFKMQDLYNIYKYSDTEDTLNIFAEKLDDFESIKGATIFVDEYMDFTPAQYLVIEKLIYFSKNIYFSLLTDFKNLHSKMNMFLRSNSTILNIKNICEKYNIPLLENISLSNKSYYNSEDLSFLEKNYELIQNLNMKPLLNISSLEEGMYNYQYYNILAKFFKQKSILYSNNKKKQKKYNENLMKSNNYYAEKDKYLLKMIDFLDEKTTESYFIDMNSKRLNNSLFEIVVKDVDFAIFHSMNIEILQKLKEKNIFIDEIRISKINDYVNTNI